MEPEFIDEPENVDPDVVNADPIKPSEGTQTVISTPKALLKFCRDCRYCTPHINGECHGVRHMKRLVLE